jgi:hypothetical protein
MSFGLDGAASLVPQLGTGRWGGGGGEEDGGPLTGAACQWWWWVDRGGCLDPAMIGSYGGGSRSTREEKTTRTGSATDASEVEEHQHARVRV